MPDKTNMAKQLNNKDKQKLLPNAAWNALDCAEQLNGAMHSQVSRVH